MTEEQLVDGLGRLVDGYIHGKPDPDVLIRTLGTLTAYTLATLMRASHLLPDDIDAFLADFCTMLCQTTVDIIREEDDQNA